MTRLTGSCVVLVRTDHLLTPRRGFVVALRRSGLPFRRPPATGLLGHYPDRTFTGKPNAACQGTPAGFASCCGLVSCHRLHAVSSLRFDAGISPDAGSQLPGTLASPRAGLAPAGCPQLCRSVTSCRPPCRHHAQTAGRTPVRADADRTHPAVTPSDIRGTKRPMRPLS